MEHFIDGCLFEKADKGCRKSTAELCKLAKQRLISPAFTSAEFESDILMAWFIERLDKVSEFTNPNSAFGWVKSDAGRGRFGLEFRNRSIQLAMQEQLKNGESISSAAIILTHATDGLRADFEMSSQNIEKICKGMTVDSLVEEDIFPLPNPLPRTC